MGHSEHSVIEQRKQIMIAAGSWTAARIAALQDRRPTPSQKQLSSDERIVPFHSTPLSPGRSLTPHE
jgi:hypothetical protein